MKVFYIFYIFIKVFPCTIELIICLMICVYGVWSHWLQGYTLQILDIGRAHSWVRGMEENDLKILMHLYFICI